MFCFGGAFIPTLDSDRHAFVLFHAAWWLWEISQLSPWQYDLAFNGASAENAKQCAIQPLSISVHSLFADRDFGRTPGNHIYTDAILMQYRVQHSCQILAAVFVVPAPAQLTPGPPSKTNRYIYCRSWEFCFSADTTKGATEPHLPKSGRNNGLDPTTTPKKVDVFGQTTNHLWAAFQRPKCPICITPCWFTFKIFQGWWFYPGHHPDEDCFQSNVHF